MEQRLRIQLEKFVKLSDEDWSALACGLYVRKISKKEYFIRKGEYGKEIGIVLHGTLRQFYEKDAENEAHIFSSKICW